jgi:osmotically-inducible protein OsmY
MRTDSQLHDDAKKELENESGFDLGSLQISVSDGAALLAGCVPTFAQKWQAENVVSHVPEIKSVVSDIEVCLPADAQRSDAEVAAATRSALRRNLSGVSDRIQVTVRDGCITLSGNVDSVFEQNYAFHTVRDLVGVRDVENHLALTPSATPAIVHDSILAVLLQSAELDARRIQVEMHEDTVILRGEVDSWTERMDAERAAWSVPGVARVENRIVIPPWDD